MMKKFLFMIILFTLFFAPLSQAAAQQTDDPPESLVFFDTTGFPQWAKDLRRFDIIAFGTFPFSMFFVNFFYDIYRWNSANGMDFSAEGRLYAPWPFRSAGGINKTNVELRNTIIMSAGLSVVLAIVDLVIHKNRQKRELNRIQSTPPPGIINIIRTPGEDAEPPDGSGGYSEDYPLDSDDSSQAETT